VPRRMIWSVSITVGVHADTASAALTKVAELLKDLGQPVVAVSASEQIDWLETSD
jgi:cell division GTPase FtsZ